MHVRVVIAVVAVLAGILTVPSGAGAGTRFDHLNPGGVVTVFVQLYEAGMPAVKSEIATFLEVFPNGVVFGNTHQGGGYDVVLLGQKDPKPIDIDKIDYL